MTEPTTNPPQSVDAYKITIEERDGFKFVILRFLISNDQRSLAVELHPAFAYALSDELLKASARAAAPGMDRTEISEKSGP